MANSKIKWLDITMRIGLLKTKMKKKIKMKNKTKIKYVWLGFMFASVKPNRTKPHRIIAYITQNNIILPSKIYIPKIYKL